MEDPGKEDAEKKKLLHTLLASVFTDKSSPQKSLTQETRVKEHEKEDPRTHSMSLLKGLVFFFFMYPELDTREKYWQDILKYMMSKQQKIYRQTSDNFAKKFRTTFNQHKAFHKPLT